MFFAGCPRPVPIDNDNTSNEFPPGTVRTIAGTGVAGFSGDGGNALRATLNTPVDVALVGSGFLLIADFDNHRIRRVDLASGDISTIAGDGRREGADAIAFPSGVSPLSGGGFLVAEWGGHRVLRFADEGPRQVVFGTAADECAEVEPAALPPQTTTSYPRSIDVMADGSILVGEQGCHRVRRVNDNAVTTYAGTGDPGYAGDNDSAEAALLFAGAVQGGPSFGISLSPEDPPDELFIADTANHVIRQVGLFTRRIETFAGTGQAGFLDGPPEAAMFNRPTHVFSGFDHSLWIVDAGNHAIRYVDPLRTRVTTVVGTGAAGFNGDGLAPADTQLNSPAAVWAGVDGRVFIADSGNHRLRMYELTPDE